MDDAFFQEYFMALDSLEIDALCNEYLHPDLTVYIIGVEGVDAPLNRDQFLEIVRSGNSGEQSVIHIPGIVKSQGNLAFVDGYLKVSVPDRADNYSKFTDYFKFKGDKIYEYNICSYTM